MTDVELAIQDAHGIEIARDLGVTRVELCSALALGGLTPSIALVEQACAQVSTHTLIRPRAGGFEYTPEEIDLIAADIERAVDAGTQGVVVGALDARGMPDLAALARFVEAAGSAEVTFHRAIDVAADIREAARMLIGRGVARILTSGGAPSAYEGRGVLADLVDICGEKIQIQAGAGINATTVRAIADTGVAAVHFSAKRSIRGRRIVSGGVNFGGYDTTDAAAARATIEALRTG